MMKVDRVWCDLRRDLFCGYITQSIVDRLAQSTHPDAPFLLEHATPFVNGLHSEFVQWLLELDDPRGKLYAKFICIIHGEIPLVDHPLSLLLRARTVEEYEHVALTYNEPEAWFQAARLLLWFHNDDNKYNTYMKNAADLGHDDAMVSFACSLPILERMSYIAVLSQHRIQGLLQRWHSRIAKGGEKCHYAAGRISTRGEWCEFYRDQIKRARKATLTGILCLKRVGIHRDVIPIIARLVWNDRGQTIYSERPRRSKRLKK